MMSLLLWLLLNHKNNLCKYLVDYTPDRNHQSNNSLYLCYHNLYNNRLDYHTLFDFLYNSQHNKHYPDFLYNKSYDIQFPCQDYSIRNILLYHHHPKSKSSNDMTPHNRLPSVHKNHHKGCFQMYSHHKWGSLYTRCIRHILNDRCCRK